VGAGPKTTRYGEKWGVAKNSHCGDHVQKVGISVKKCGKTATNWNVLI
jgi:hypothetical protein